MTKLIEMISNTEDNALKLGDLDTAIKLNWLRNACKFNDITEDEAIIAYMNISIVGKYVEEKRGRYGDFRACVSKPELSVDIIQ